MTRKLTFPFELKFEHLPELLEFAKWAERGGLNATIKGDSERRVYVIDCALPDGRPLSRIIETIKRAIDFWSDERATFNALRNTSSFRHRVPDETIQFIIDQLCRTGELVRIDGVHKQSGKPLPRYKLGESE